MNTTISVKEEEQESQPLPIDVFDSSRNKITDNKLDNMENKEYEEDEVKEVKEQGEGKDELPELLEEWDDSELNHVDYEQCPHKQLPQPECETGVPRFRYSKCR